MLSTGALPVELPRHGWCCVRVEAGTGYEPATSGTWPDTNLAGTAMMIKLERNDEENYEDEAEAEAALYS